jgi:hypothetical protein
MNIAGTGQLAMSGQAREDLRPADKIRVMDRRNHLLRLPG